MRQKTNTTNAMIGITEMDDYYNGDYDDDRYEFADPGGTSALRAATKRNPRNLSCPTCKTRNVLTQEDRARHYQCDACANALERGYDIG